MTYTLENAHRDFNELNREAVMAAHERRQLAYTIADAVSAGNAPDEATVSNYQHWTLKHATISQQLEAIKKVRDDLIAQRNA